MVRKWEQVTQPTNVAVDGFIEALPDAEQRADSQALCALMQEVTGEPPVLWGSSIIGFGQYHYRYSSGHEGDTALVSFAPRKQQLVLYLSGEFETKHAATMARLGPHKTGKGCLYLKGLAGVDRGALRELIADSVRVHQNMDQPGS